MIHFRNYFYAGCQLEVQNLGATGSLSQYAVGHKENDEDNAITKQILQQEIMNMKNTGRSSKSSSTSRESSVGKDLNNSSNRNLTREESGSKRSASVSHSNSSTSVNSARAFSPEKMNNNSNSGSPISIQNILKKFSKDSNKTPSPTTELKNSLSSNNNKVCQYNWL